jgi:hypothetical protein
MPKADRDVYIVNVGGEYRVRPAIAAVKGQTAGGGGRPLKVKFKNAADAPVTVLFPSGICTPSSIPIDPGKTGELELLDLPAPPAATEAPAVVVTYAVIVSKGTEWIMATGESGPRLIIDP